MILEPAFPCMIPSVLELLKGFKFKFRKHILFSRSIYADLYFKKFCINPIKNVKLIQSVFFLFKKVAILRSVKDRKPLTVKGLILFTFNQF